VNRRQLLKSIGIGAGALGLGRFRTLIPAFGLGVAKGNIKNTPNFLFILADDLGWSQVGCYGGDFYETPNIDKLAREGMLFTDAYAACPVCSPTRASIMTGRYPARLHLTDFIAGGSFPYEKYLQPKWQKYLPLEEITIAEVLKTVGYATASFGKWHLSIDKKPPKSLPYNPDKQGFDEYFVTYKPSSKTDPESDAHNVEVITEKSLDFMERHKGGPFFLYVSHNTIHAPIMGKRRLVDKYKRKPGSDSPQNNPVLGAMIEELDNSTGRLLKKLDELGIADKTIVVFFGDNGGLESDAKQTPLRSGKANLYEGGIREPLIIRWPGVIEPGGTCSEPVISIDFFPTLLEIAGVRNEAKRPMDGASLVPLLRQSGTLNRRAIYWHYPHYHSSSIGPCGAVREGAYKLIEWYDESICGPGNEFELYNLKEDVGERNNLAKKMPERVEKLKKMLSDWRSEVNAQMPAPNPNYDSRKAKKSGKRE
jgi:arylsulfatase A